MRLMISGGGTGGHVYPALAVVQALQALDGNVFNNSASNNKIDSNAKSAFNDKSTFAAENAFVNNNTFNNTFNKETSLLWVGSENGLEKNLLEKANIPYQGISAAGLRGKNFVAALKGLFKLGLGYWQSKKIIKDFKPHVLFVTGGYVCAPVTMAAYHLDIPIIIYLPDIQPGQAIKFLSRFATKIAVTAPPAQVFFPANLTVVTGYPVRKALYNTTQQTARANLNLEPTRPTILILGGSQGAHSINKAITNPDTLAKLLAKAQLIHVSGKHDADWTQAIYQNLPATQQKHYHLYSYLHQKIIDAFAAADLMVCRAGASILGEAPAVGLPAILVPYPHSGAHQWPNAHYLANQGAATIVADEDLEKLLSKTILNLLNNLEKRSDMAAAARRLAQPEAARAIATQIQEVRYVRRSTN